MCSRQDETSVSHFRALGEGVKEARREVARQRGGSLRRLF